MKLIILGGRRRPRPLFKIFEHSNFSNIKSSNTSRNQVSTIRQMFEILNICKPLLLPLSRHERIKTWRKTLSICVSCLWSYDANYDVSPVKDTAYGKAITNEYQNWIGEHLNAPCILVFVAYLPGTSNDNHTSDWRLKIHSDFHITFVLGGKTK